LAENLFEQWAAGGVHWEAGWALSEEAAFFVVVEVAGEVGDEGTGCDEVFAVAGEEVFKRGSSGFQ